VQPEFLEVEDILLIHADQLERYGGLAGLRDHGLLVSAVSMPRSTYGGEFLHGDLFAMAAAYLFHITRNHPFLDGNKRTGAAAALVFLDLHGIEVAATDDALYDLVIAVAKGDTGKDAVAAFLQTHSRRS
jgi:death-on-curing protein